MVKAVVGANWGDEGKGKITDMLGKEADIIVRFQGGANAGHTIVNDYGKFALHTLPSGVFYEHTTSIIGNGVALDIPKLFAEVQSVVEKGVPTPKILVSDRAQIVMSYHKLFDAYKDVTSDKLFDNLVYFLNAIGPVCEKYNIKMAIHPDDPAWPVFNLPRIITGKEAILKMLKAVDKPYNGITLCMGSLGTNLNNDLPDIIRSCKGRIHFAHIRNLHHFAPGVFEEAAHLSSDGSFDMYEAVKALHDIGFDGPARPDHGRTIWGEKCMPGYGLYDRALGAMYIQGLWEAIDKAEKRGV